MPYGITGFTHREGGKRTRAASHNKQRENERKSNKGRQQAEEAHNEQAEQRGWERKERGRKVWKEHTGTRGTQKSNSANQSIQQSKQHSSEKTEAGQQMERTNTHMSPKPCILHPWAHQRGKREGAPSYIQVCRIAPRDRGAGVVPSCSIPVPGLDGCHAHVLIANEMMRDENKP